MSQMFKMSSKNYIFYTIFSQISTFHQSSVLANAYCLELVVSVDGDKVAMVHSSNDSRCKGHDLCTLFNLPDRCAECMSP